MQTLSIQHINEEHPRHIITECDDTDACKSCGAGYRVGLTACEYCRMPVVWSKHYRGEDLPGVPSHPVPLEQVKCRYW